MGSNQTKLTSTEFQELLKGTKFSKEEINDWFNKFKAEFPRGRIRKYEFMVMYTKLFPDGDATEFTDHIFRMYDQDKNGVIDFQEFMITVSIAQRGTKEEKLKWAFRLYDLDGNGKLTLKEIETVLAVSFIVLHFHQFRSEEILSRTSPDVLCNTILLCSNVRYIIIICQY